MAYWDVYSLPSTPLDVHLMTALQQTIQLMSVDLLRQQQRWKDTLMEIREIMASLVQEGFNPDNMRPWRLHWDHQLYKALEHQYQLGLEALSENLPEIKVEMIYRYIIYVHYCLHIVNPFDFNFKMLHLFSFPSATLLLPSTCLPLLPFSTHCISFSPSSILPLSLPFSTRFLGLLLYCPPSPSGYLLSYLLPLLLFH